jgi:6-phosphogluconolactonase/glucosamine-6-phosphate isomerase/deaminase
VVVMETLLALSSTLPQLVQLLPQELWQTLHDDAAFMGTGTTWAAIGLIMRGNNTRAPQKIKGAILVQENAGFHLGIARDLDATSEQAANFVKDQYDAWLERGWAGVETVYKTAHFTVAVGGGNTVRAQYDALIDLHANDIDWVRHVRFFFLEESSGEKKWRSAHDNLVNHFIRPLADKLCEEVGTATLAASVDLDSEATLAAITAQMITTMTFPIKVQAVKEALQDDDPERARSEALKECTRYTRAIKKYLGEEMSFHLIISGIAKDGGIGAFPPYHPALRKRKPGTVILEQDSGAIRIALSRGVLINAQRVSLIIAGNLKLRALGRFEMEDSASFEQTVNETPLRMFRESESIANRVFIFADSQALHFEEGTLKFRHEGKKLRVKMEEREGTEDNGVHALLLHGFMGLYSYVNLIIQLPGAWKVSALHRGQLAKTMPEENIFPHYALCLRKAILQSWGKQRPTPIVCHSMGGMVSAHMLLSTQKTLSGPLAEFEDLGKDDQALIEAMRASGIVHLAAWAPADALHLLHNVSNLIGHLRRKTPLNYAGPDELYVHNLHGGLQFNPAYEQEMVERPRHLDTLLKYPGTSHIIHLANNMARFVLSKNELQKLLSTRSVPYGLRVIGERMLKKISFYGLLKEFSAAMHDPHVYIERHLRALEIILKYDIPFLSIIHTDDFIVSANRHKQEHEYLLARRLEKEGVAKEADLQVPVGLVLLERGQQELPLDPLNPHLMLMSTYQEGDRIARELTAAITQFVNQNVARAIKQEKVPPLQSVLKKRRRSPTEPAG